MLPNAAVAGVRGALLDDSMGPWCPGRSEPTRSDGKAASTPMDR